MRILLFILMLCCAGAAMAQTAELRVALWGATEAPRAGAVAPQSSGLSGFNEDLAREICRRINARCRLETVVFADILPGIEGQRFDMGFGNFLRTPEREKRVAFSEMIWSSSSRLLGRVDNDRRLAARFGADLTLDKLRDVRIGAILETQQYAYLESIAGERGLRLSGVRTMAEALTLLREGRVDYCLFPMLTAFEMLRREEFGKYEFVGQPLVDNGLGGSVHIALPKGRESLRQAVNAAIAALRADGTYPRLVRRHFPFSID
jgi:ABC-type amino acid transport substrate-binding protein